jgi:copper chaperone CopZ
MTIHELQVQGMRCGHCVRAVQDALTEVPGVRKAEVSIGHARVETEDDVSRQALVAALAEEDYEVVSG